MIMIFGAILEPNFEMGHIVNMHEIQLLELIS